MIYMHTSSTDLNYFVSKRARKTAKKMDKIMDQIIVRKHNKQIYSLRFFMFSFLRLLVEVHAQHCIGLEHQPRAAT